MEVRVGRWAVLLLGLGVGCGGVGTPGGATCPPEVCEPWCQEQVTTKLAEAGPSGETASRTLTAVEANLVGDRLREIRLGVRTPQPPTPFFGCAGGPCGEEAMTQLTNRLEVGTTLVYLKLLVPPEGEWPLVYRRTCRGAGDLPAWALEPVERPLALRGNREGLAVVQLVDRFDIGPPPPPTDRPKPVECMLEVRHAGQPDEPVVSVHGLLYRP